MKVSTEKLPNSLLLLDIELEREQVEKGLDRAARRISQKHTIPGFRKGKAPRFIIENYFGRAALVEEATDDLINNAFKTVLQQEQLNPVGQPELAGLDSIEPFRFRVRVPVPPTVTLPDYAAIRVPLEVTPITDEALQQAMDVRRERHVVLKELEEPRPIQAGDQVSAKIETIVDGEPLEQRDEGEEIRESALVMEPGRLVDELYTGLLGMSPGETGSITAQMPDDHPNEQVRGKEVTFNVEVVGMQERMLPDWEEVPVLEEVEGSLDDLRAKTREELQQAAQSEAENAVLEAYIEQLVAQTEFDVPEVMIRDTADDMLEDQGRQFARYGVTIDQLLQYRGQTRDNAIDELLPEAEKRLKRSLALRELAAAQELTATEAEIDAEIATLLADYSDDQRETAREMMEHQLRPNIASIVIDKKLRKTVLALATGSEPAADTPPATPAAAADTAAPAPAAEEETDTTATRAGEASA